MKRFFDLLYRTCVLPISADEDAARKEYILNVILVSSILMLSVLDGLVFYHTLLHGQNYFGVQFKAFTALLLSFILLHVLSRRGHSIISAYFLIAALFLSTSYATYIWDVDLPVALLAYAFIICTAGILIGTAFGFVVTALTAFAMAITWHLHVSGIVIPRRQDPSEDDVIVFAIFYVLIMAVSWLSNREIEKSLARARRSESALKEERDLLEVRVAERTEELRRVQFEEVEHIGRLAEFGQLASGLFHDLLNLLNAISLRTEGRGEEGSSLEAAYSTTRQIQQFMQGIQRQLGERNVRESFSLIEGIEQAIQLVDYKAKRENIRIIFFHKTQKPLVYSGIPFKFHQIVINLLTNAIDSYQSLAKEESARRTIAILTDASDGVFSVSVEDKGSGIPKDTLEKIFEPFFTTKSKTQGTGIGLASIKKIIEEDFRGTIKVKSTEHVGSTFTVIFPLTMPSLSEKLPHHPHEHSKQTLPPPRI